MYAIKWFRLSVLIAALDQASKYLAVRHLELHRALSLLPGLDLTLVHNTGAAFSFLRDAGGWQRWFFIGLSSTVALVIIVWLARLHADRARLACALSLVLGGAIGNMWDRVNLGYVIDFVDVYVGTWHWPAFNVADSAISIGAIILIVDALWLDQAEIDVYSGKPAKVDRPGRDT